jgi:hypothetical protein
MTPDTADPNGGGGDDVVVTDRQLFESALSDPAPSASAGAGSAPAEPPAQADGEAPAQAGEQQEPQEQPQPGGQPRNERGQFAPRQQQPQQPQQQPRPQPQGGPQPPHHVPLRELLDERERRYRIQAEADQMRQAWAQLQQQQEMAALAQQQAQMPQTIYDNPDAYLQHNVVAPLLQQVEMARLRDKDAMSREFANVQFGPQSSQLIEAALQAMAQVRHTPQGDFIFRQIMASGHPYGALVQWFNNARAQQAIGPDPNAWVQRQRQAWLDDEQMQAEAARRYYAKQQRQQQPQQQQRGPGSPPNVQLPPSLSSLPASSGRADAGGDLSDAHLWRFATR